MSARYERQRAASTRWSVCGLSGMDVISEFELVLVVVTVGAGEIGRLERYSGRMRGGVLW